MDLFTPIVEERNFHPNFLNTINEEESYLRDVLNEWQEGFVDRDNKFVREFQTSFNSSFWELYLFACIKEIGYSVDFSVTSPDFLVDGNELDFCIEASTANPAIDSTPEWDRNLSLENLEKNDLDEIIDFATIRLANTMVSKYKKYQDAYQDLAHVKNRPFILAIAPFEQPFFYMQNLQAIRRVLYGYDIPIFRDFPRENYRIIYGHRFIEYIEKPNGAKIPLGYFAKEEMKEISAVIYSNTATFGKVRALSKDPGDWIFLIQSYNENGLQARFEAIKKVDYHETLLDGLNVYHNPFASNPLPLNAFKYSGVTQHWFDIEEEIPNNDAVDGSLLQRNALKFNYFGS